MSCAQHYVFLLQEGQVIECSQISDIRFDFAISVSILAVSVGVHPDYKTATLPLSYW